MLYANCILQSLRIKTKETCAIKFLNYKMHLTADYGNIIVR